MGLFSKKPKSIIVQQPSIRAAAEGETMDRLEHLLPKVEVAPPLATPPKIDSAARAAQPANPPRPVKRNRKFSVDPADFLALRAELVEMRARLDESEHARAVVEARLGSLDAAAADDGVHGQLSAKVDALQNRLSGLQDPSPKFAEFEAQLARLRSELDVATAAADAAAALPPPPPPTSGPDPETLERIESLHQRMGELDNLEQRLANVDELRTQIDQLSQRSSTNDAEARAVREHMAVLDQRLTNVSTELANQLGELGRDIDGLGQRIPEVADGVASGEVVDALRGGQVKLAKEQARYEIAFREDLAALAEQLRRGHDDDNNN